MEAVAKHDFKATQADELSFTKGATLKVVCCFCSFSTLCVQFSVVNCYKYHTFCSLRYGVAIHDLRTLSLPYSFYREHFYTCLRAEFIHRVHCEFEMIMVRDNILSIP